MKNCKSLQDPKKIIDNQIEVCLITGSHSNSHDVLFSNSKRNIESTDNTAYHSDYEQSFDNKLETTSNTIGDEDMSDVYEQLMIDHKDSTKFGNETVRYGEMNDCLTSN